MLDISAEIIVHRRFNINKDSMELMRSVSSELMQDESLKVRGVAFWGSRIKSGIKGQSKESSDLDTAVFYDGSDYPEDRYVYETNKFPEMRDGVDAKVNHEKTIRRKAATLVAGKVPVTVSLDELMDSINTIDISPKNLDYLLEDYKINYQKELSVNRLALASLFLIGTGDGLYQARKYVLDKLGNNDALFSNIMNDLSSLERPQNNSFFPAPRSKPQGPPPYSGYPKTISEARKYFLLK